DAAVEVGAEVLHGVQVTVHDRHAVVQAAAVGEAQLRRHQRAVAVHRQELIVVEGGRAPRRGEGVGGGVVIEDRAVGDVGLGDEDQAAVRPAGKVGILRDTGANGDGIVAEQDLPQRDAAGAFKAGGEQSPVVGDGHVPGAGLAAAHVV